MRHFARFCALTGCIVLGASGLTHCGSGAVTAVPTDGSAPSEGGSTNADGGSDAEAPPVEAVAPLWKQTFEGGSAQEIAITPTGDAVVVGSEFTTDNFEDILVVRLSQDGGVVWQKRFGGAGQDLGASVAVDESGDVYIAGKIGSETVDFGGGVVVDGWKTGREYGFVARLDGANGQAKWVRMFRATNIDGAPVFVDQVAARNGAVAIGGRFDGTLAYDGAEASGDGGVATIEPYGKRTALFALLDADDGRARWLIRAGTPEGSIVYAQGLALDPSGDVLGAFTINGGALEGLGASRPIVGGDSNLVLARLSATDGSPAYVRQFGGEGGASAFRLSLDGQGPLQFAGSVRGAIDLGLGPISPIDGDGLWLTIDPATGQPTAQRTFGGAESDVVRSARAVGATGDVLVAGSYDDPSSNNALPRKVVEGMSLPDPTDGEGTFVVRYGADGHAKWVRAAIPVAGPQNQPRVLANDVAAFPNGTVLVAGAVFGKGDLGDGKIIEGPQGIARVAVWAWPP